MHVEQRGDEAEERQTLDWNQLSGRSRYGKRLNNCVLVPSEHAETDSAAGTDNEEAGPGTGREDIRRRDD